MVIDPQSFQTSSSSSSDGFPSPTMTGSGNSGLAGHGMVIPPVLDSASSSGNGSISGNTGRNLADHSMVIPPVLDSTSGNKCNVDSESFDAMIIPSVTDSAGSIKKSGRNGIIPSVADSGNDDKDLVGKNGMFIPAVTDSGIYDKNGVYKNGMVIRPVTNSDTSSGIDSFDLDDRISELDDSGYLKQQKSGPNVPNISETVKFLGPHTDLLCKNDSNESIGLLKGEKIPQDYNDDDIADYSTAALTT